MIPNFKTPSTGAADEIDQKGRIERAEQSPAEPEGMQSPRGVYCDRPHKAKLGAASQGLQPAHAHVHVHAAISGYVIWQLAIPLGQNMNSLHTPVR